MIRTSIQSAVKDRYPEDRTLAGIRVAKREFQDRANLAKLPKYHGSKDQRAVDAWIDTWLSPEFTVWILNESLAAIRYPMHVVHENRDEYESVEHPRRIAAGCGIAHIMPDSGHVPHKERETFLIEMIHCFLKAI